ncbi:MAG TPA: NYN domain-containing protein [Candidatus Baltobacteraceae bacterium]|nr:NYN domain-containing protein [Candidatus Baltobacteraceae bacterium]
MNVAVFVDAGYLYALATQARYHTSHPRGRVSLSVEAVVAELKREVAALDGGGNRLIRIYWYDGAPISGRTAEQTRTAALGDVKLRLGSVNQYGQQKGVDALIVHDMSELARNRAIDALILLSGDEDVLVGVQTAQTFGVRVHLLGIDPYRTQSEKLRFESDATHEWTEGLVAPWISLRPVIRAAGDEGEASPEGGSTDAEPPSPIEPDQMRAIVSELLPFFSDRIPTIVANWDRLRRIPIDVNTRLMKASSQILGRPIDASERIAVRSLFVETLRGPDEAEGAEAGEPRDEAAADGEAEVTAYDAAPETDPAERNGAAGNGDDDPPRTDGETRDTGEPVG